MSETNLKMNETTGTGKGEVLKGEPIETATTQSIVAKKSSPSPSKEVNSLPAVLTQDELATLDYADFSTPARMLALGTVLAKSQLVPLKKPEDVVVALMTGKELGLPFVTSVTQIYPINGRPTLGVHIQKAILLNNGVTFMKIEDAIEIYSYVKNVGDKFEEILQGTKDEQPADTKKKLIGFRTTYEFSREIKRPSGKYKEITAKSSFSTMEAATADLLDKDVWKKYYKRMLDARAFTIGAREIADDLLLGIYSPNEVSNDYYINDANEEVHIANVVTE